MGVNANNKKSFNELLKNEINGDLVLPDFQRGFVWKIDQQKALAATFLTRIPLTSLLLLQGTKKDFGYKRLCVKNKEISDVSTEDARCIFLLDGQQRLSTLKNVFSDVYSSCNGEWESVFDKIDNKLKYRWFINLWSNKRVDENTEFDDVFGIERLSKPKQLDKLEPVDLIDYIEYRKIKKGDVKNKENIKWWHPSFLYFSDNRTPAYESKKRAAEEYMIPLYKFFSDENSNVKVTAIITAIAKSRAEALKAEIAEGVKEVDEIFVEEEQRKLYDEKPEVAWEELRNNWADAMNEMVAKTVSQDIYFIELNADEIGRAVTIFENMNASGTRLSVFDLVVARAATGNRGCDSLISCINERLKEEFAIPNALASNIKEMVNIAEDMKLIKDDEIDTDFKNAFISMLPVKKKIDSISNKNGSMVKISSDDLKQNKILKLSSDEIYSSVNDVIDALKRAYAFLQYRCGLISIKNLSYRLMIIPIACIFLDKERWNNKVILDRVECWYWASIFDGSFSANQNNKSSEDIKKLFDFAVGGYTSIFDERINNVFNLRGYSDLDALLGTDDYSWNEAMHQGILSYILSRNPLDFQKTASIHLRAWEAARKLTVSYNHVDYVIDLHDHHLIPLCQDMDNKYSDSEKNLRKDKKFILNSPLNRTYITSEANTRISKDKIDSYMNDINGYSTNEHFIPSSLKKKKNENNETYYRRVLTDRYKLLSEEMKKELEYLKHDNE
ncbi:DUF262 domain-containing protein [Selenomonas ruminis]|uniref:DUF262 domain-containing protein n=1 Tax=Selenomonas ruminis TaxID=2593411 RepID=UPI00165673B2|nr:DUF262 domain-containing protein [Selenomonas sp. mPRGC5]